MEEIEKKDWKALKEYSQYTRAAIEVKKQNNTYYVQESEEKRLLERRYISFDKNTKNLHHEDYVLTEKGYVVYCQLREIKWKYWVYLGTIANILFGFLNIFLFGRSVHWW